MIGPLLVLALGVGRARGASRSVRARPPSRGRAQLASAGSSVWFGVGALDASASGWAVDTLAALMLLVVGVVALMVMVFSIGYMAEDPGWVRYFALLSLFTGSMTLLVIGDSFATLFIGWELVGACSYLLIGFWYQKPSATAAAVKAFLTTRVGDVGLLLGLAVLWAATGSLGYAEVMAGLEPMARRGRSPRRPCCWPSARSGKSAQFPLHIWLPDAMEGPTPVSALIHAATMVAAGVFLVARTWPLFEAAPTARTVLLAVGADLGAWAPRSPRSRSATSRRCSRTRRSASSASCSRRSASGAWAVAFFHLVTHAAFKALLFLASGSVIHGSGTQDLREMGGLRKEMPVTFARVARRRARAGRGSGRSPGFFSKDAVLDAVWIAVAARGCGALRDRVRDRRLLGPRDPARVLRRPGEATGTRTRARLSMLRSARGAGRARRRCSASPAAGSSTRLGEQPEPLSLPISAVAVGLGLLRRRRGLVAREWRRPPTRRLSAVSASAWRAGAVGVRLGRGWSTRVVVVPVAVAARVLWAVVDRFLIDGVVEGIRTVARWAGGVVSRLQNGDAQWYGALIAAGVALMLVASIWLGR